MYLSARYPKIQVQFVIVLIEDGQTHRAIAENLEISAGAVQKALNLHHLTQETLGSQGYLPLQSSSMQERCLTVL